MTRVVMVKDAVIGSPPRILQGFIDQSDRNTPLSCVITLLVVVLD